MTNPDNALIVHYIFSPHLNLLREKHFLKKYISPLFQESPMENGKYFFLHLNCSRDIQIFDIFLRFDQEEIENRIIMLS